MSRKTRKRPIRKQSFLLFELLLSMGLVLLCLFPLIQTHMGIAKAEQAEIRTLEQRFYVQEAVCALKKRLHEHEFTWEQLMQNVKEEHLTLTKLEQSTKKGAPESGLVLLATFSFDEETTYERTLYVTKTRSLTH